MTAANEPSWVPAVAVNAIHRQQILEHGGLQGLRDSVALDAALNRPRQRWISGELATIPELAGAYAEAIVRSHPFVDGNKRSGFLVAVVFLGLNNHRFNATNESLVITIQLLAAGELPWAELKAWFMAYSFQRS